MANEEEWKSFLRQHSTRRLPPQPLQSYQDAVRALLDDDDYYGGPAVMDTAPGGSAWWSQYGIGPILIVVMMVTQLWALVDRDTSSGGSNDRGSVCAADRLGGCR